MNMRVNNCNLISHLPVEFLDDSHYSMCAMSEIKIPSKSNINRYYSHIIIYTVYTIYY